jgi:CHAD domain-containing protein
VEGDCLSYRLKSGEPVCEAVKRIAAEQIGAAAAALGQGRGDRDEAVHEARKRIKKVRALLRLVRPQLGRAYRPENRVLRDAGRKLSEYRDAASVIESFDQLRAKYKDELSEIRFDSVRRGLLESKRKLESSRDWVVAIQQIADTLDASAGRAHGWMLKTGGFCAISQGLHATYREARQRMADAARHGGPQYCHDWRKRLKDNWYQIRLLENLWVDWALGYEKSLKDLETWLGEHHNLQVLRETILKQPGNFGQETDVDLCLKLVCKDQKELRKNALSLGERVYEEPPQRFRDRVKHLWLSWRSQPKSLSHIEKLKRKKAA